MLYRDIPVFALCEAYEYVDDAERRVKGFIMRGGLWHRRLGRLVTGSITSEPTSSAQFGFDGKVWFLHRAIFAMMNGGISQNMLVDHKDRDRSHNRIGNLRALSPSQNQMNRGKARSDSTVKYLGVCVSDNLFSAFVSSGGKPVYLGRFRSAEEAARVRDEEIENIHGAYATLNRDIFPELRNKD